MKGCCFLPVSLLRNSQFSVLILLLLINSAVLTAMLYQPCQAAAQFLRHSHKRTLNHVSSHSRHRREYYRVSTTRGKKSLSHRHNRKRLDGRHSKKRRSSKVAHKPKQRYAYPLSFFLAKPPTFELDPLPREIASKINNAFEEGTADSFAAKNLIRAGVVRYHPLRGGIFFRREPVKYIIIHSTETGIPMGAVRVIESWSSGGLRHAGAQYVVERDGTIYQSVDPDLGTVHVNIFKTLPGINNDNSVGIEMCHNGQQDYPAQQVQSVIRLVSYLQQHYNVSDDDVITHRYAQQGDHTDPVNFDWQGFLAQKNLFKSKALALKAKERINTNTSSEQMLQEIEPSAYLQPHLKLESPSGDLKGQSSSSSVTLSLTTKNQPQLYTKEGNTADKTLYRQDSSISRKLPALRGPIEVDPNTAKLLSKEEDFRASSVRTTDGAKALRPSPENTSMPADKIEFIIHQK